MRLEYRPPHEVKQAWAEQQAYEYFPEYGRLFYGSAQAAY
jgi:hypothetical protein